MLAVMAKNEIRNVPIFREPDDIFKKFQNWHIGVEKIIGELFEAFCSKLTFACCLWRKTKFAKFAMCQYFANQMRYSKNSKTGISGLKK